MERSCVVSRQNADIADTLQLREVAMDTGFGTNYISCKWPLTGDEDMEISYKGRFVFSQPLRLLDAVGVLYSWRNDGTLLIQSLGGAT